MDSVYVFAFYTDEILTSGGPEGFSGLPGMILGIAIPRLNATWFATKLELTAVPSPLSTSTPVKGKKTTRSELNSILKINLKDWGEWADKNIWWIML
jgi:GLPGLI family protein